MQETYSSDFHYNLRNFENKKKENKLRKPKQLATILLEILISTFVYMF